MMRLRAVEAAKWLAAPIDVPDLNDLYEHRQKMAEALRQLQEETTKRVDAPSLISGGSSAVEAAEAQREAQQQVKDLEQARKAAVDALQRADKALALWVAGNRSFLIGEANTKAQELLDAAAPLAEKLDGFLPALSSKEISLRATKPELDAWRESQDLNHRFQLLLAAFVTSWKTATKSAGDLVGADQFPQRLRAEAPGGIHVWSDPLAVGDVAVRVGKGRHVINIARWRDVGGYRLIDGHQLAREVNGITLEHPWGTHRRNRRVLVPGPPPAPQRPRSPVTFL